MPYKIDELHKILPKDKDRRRKLTDEERIDIKNLYFRDALPIREIARRYQDKCSRRLIQFIIDPKRYVAAKKNWRWYNYYDKEKHRKEIAETRKHRAIVFGVIPRPPQWCENETKIAVKDLKPHARIKKIDEINRTKQAVYAKRYRERLKIK